MPEEIDINKIITGLISERIDDIGDAARGTFSKVTVSLKGRLKRTYSSYIASIYKKYSAYKTLIYRETPHPLKDFYEPLDLKNDDHNLISPGVEVLAKLKQPIIITGTGGCGKSTMMRALMLGAIEIGKYIPIFIELRYLEDSKASLLEHISQNMRLHTLKLPPEFIKAAITKGGYALFLDGLDELSEENSERISEEIQQLAQASPDNLYLVTSRPGKEFVSWAFFIELKIAPLTLKKACDLTNRLEIDNKLKKRFVKDLRGGLFEKHATFFENPLLLCIMLLTYQDSASIPGELHNFYALAFDALYFRHDALKEGFRRPTKTGLPIDKGRTLMSAFSLVTYLKQKTVFTKTEVCEYLGKAISLVGMTVDPRELLVDLISAFCMLLKDGTLYTFTHRSFQEYFAAFYLIHARENQQQSICDQFINRASHDRVLDLAHGMNPELIEALVIIPFLEKIREKTKYKGKFSKAGFFRYLSLFFDRIIYKDTHPTNIMYGFRKHQDAFDYYSLIIFAKRRFDLNTKRPQANEDKIEQAKDRLASYLKSRENNEIKISVIERNRELAKDLTDVSRNFKREFHDMMKLLDELKLRHEQQVASFNDLLKG